MITTTLLIAIVLFVAALIILVPNFKLALNALNSYKWQAIEGKIIDSQLEVIEDKELEEKMHRFNVTYEYNIDNTTYQSNRLYFGDANYRGGDGSKGFLANLSNQLRPNSTVTAYYNPSQPSSSVLYKGFQTDTKILIAASIAILASALWLITDCCSGMIV